MIFNDNTTTIRYGRRLVTHKSRTLHESRHPHTTIFSDRHSDETRMIGYIHSKSIEKGRTRTHTADTRIHTRTYTFLHAYRLPNTHTASLSITRSIRDRIIRTRSYTRIRPRTSTDTSSNRTDVTGNKNKKKNVRK